MNKKIIAIGIISMFLLTGLTTVSAVEIETKNGGDSWIKITKPTDGSAVRLPLVIESEGSDDIGEVRYGFYIRGAWTWGRARKNPPYRLIWTTNSLSPGEEFKIHASGYEVDENGGRHNIADTEITLSVKKSRSVHLAFPRLLDLFPNVFPILRLLLKL